MSAAAAPTSIRDAVLEEMRRVADQQGKHLPPLADDLPLLESGLDSLCIAILVATLDDRLGIDPFSGDGPTVFPVTVGDFVVAYERSAD